MTELQKEGLNKLAKSIIENDMSIYEEKINAIKEVILGKKNVEKIDSKETVIDNDSTLNEDTQENEKDKKHKTYDMFGPK